MVTQCVVVSGVVMHLSIDSVTYIHTYMYSRMKCVQIFVFISTAMYIVTSPGLRLAIAQAVVAQTFQKLRLLHSLHAATSWKAGCETTVFCRTPFKELHIFVTLVALLN